MTYVKLDQIILCRLQIFYSGFTESFLFESRGNSFEHRRGAFHHREMCIAVSGRRRIEHANKLSVKKSAAEHEEGKKIEKSGESGSL